MNGVVIWGLALLAMASCALFGTAERAELSNHLNMLERCQEQGRQASTSCRVDGGDDEACDSAAITSYQTCKTDAGVR